MGHLRFYCAQVSDLNQRHRRDRRVEKNGQPANDLFRDQGMLDPRSPFHNISVLVVARYTRG